MKSPAQFTDDDGCLWVSNFDNAGTYRCLHAEIRAMTLEDIRKEFGPLSCDRSTT